MEIIDIKRQKSIPSMTGEDFPIEKDPSPRVPQRGKVH